MIQIICLGLLVFIAVIVVAGFNRLYSMDARIDKLVRDSEIKIDVLMHDYLIKSGWSQGADALYSNDTYLNWELKDAYRIAKTIMTRS
jgi:hypothetical protein